MSDEQREPSWDADPATPEQMQIVERVCNGLGLDGYYDPTCGWWRNGWNRPVFVPVVQSIALAYELGRADAHGTEPVAWAAHFQNGTLSQTTHDEKLAKNWAEHGGDVRPLCYALPSPKQERT